MFMAEVVIQKTIFESAYQFIIILNFITLKNFKNEF